MAPAGGLVIERFVIGHLDGIKIVFIDFVCDTIFFQIDAALLAPCKGLGWGRERDSGDYFGNMDLDLWGWRGCDLRSKLYGRGNLSGERAPIAPAGVSRGKSSA